MYLVKEIFSTIQGEGANAGKAAIFVRLANCNLWSGKDEHRERDAERNDAQCPRWCDTDFAGGDKMSGDDIVRAVERLDHGAQRMVVISGGEPMLQVKESLVADLLQSGRMVAIETNGTKPVPAWFIKEPKVWITCSPKTPPKTLALQRCDELKVVFPAYNPRDYGDSFPSAIKYVQPEAQTESVGKSLIDTANMDLAVRFVMENTAWKLSIQTHKILRIP